MTERTCCFVGYLGEEEEADLEQYYFLILELLVRYRNVDTFVLGGKGKFIELSRKLLKKLQKEYPHIGCEECEQEIQALERSKFCMAYYDKTYAHSLQKEVVRQAISFGIEQQKTVVLYP